MKHNQPTSSHLASRSGRITQMRLGIGGRRQTADYRYDGLPQSNSTGIHNNKQKHLAKELDFFQGANYYDYTARYAVPARGLTFNSIDRRAEDFRHLSPYSSNAGDPINNIDPTGESPIYSPQGEFLGCDENGITGDYIVMEESNYDEIMPEEQAKKAAIDSSTLSEDAINKIQDHYKTLPSRPDYDGYLTLEEANEWYRNGKGQTLYVDIRKIDLSGIVSLGEKYNDDDKYINLFFGSGSLNDALVFGTIRLKRYPNHGVKAYRDTYDFDMHSWLNPINGLRNIETMIGEKVAGKGQPFHIYIYGEAKLKPILPWIK